MSKEIYISSTPHETRLAIVEDDALAEIYYERENEYTLAGSIYNGKVTRVLPGMQSSFVDIGLERDAFLYITDFMEEAGDSADFESSVNGSDRAPRAEGRSDSPRDGSQRDGSQRDGSQRESSRRDGRDRPRNDRGDRGERGDRPRSGETGAEPTDTDLFNAAVSSLDPARPASASDRTGHRDHQENGRGGRNRSARNSDGSVRRDRAESPLPAAQPAGESEEFAAGTPILSGTSLSPEPLGEGAPGADGSRRWRGRRGRRSMRPVEREEGAAAPVAGDADSEGSFVDYDRLDIDASAAVPIVPITAAPEADTSFIRPERTPAPDRAERAERPSRGERGRDRNDRGNRGSREDRPAQPPRVPRGFAPKNLYGAAPVEEEAPVYGREVFPEAPAEPVILPGESLSKYRPASEGVAAPALAEAVKPSTEFVLPTAWDGGLVLPGETLRRREPSRARTAAAEPVAEVTAAPAVELNSTFVAPPPMPVAEPRVMQDEVKAEVTPAEPKAEYEPTEASASFRVDVAPVREFRQPAAPVLEPDVEAAAAPSAVHDVLSDLAEDPESPLTLVRGVELPLEHAPGHAPKHAQKHAPEHAPDLAPDLEPHELTSISAEGEMYSDAPMDAAAETRVHDLPVAEVSSHNHEAQHFAPGAGVLEEEVLEDEEEIPSLQGSAVELEEFEEQETLEGAADLGTMIREMSIDQITRPAPEVLAEDGEEEDFLEEDQDYTLEDAEEEDEPETAVADESDHVSAPHISAEPVESARAGRSAAPGTRDDGRRDGRRSERDRSRRSGGFSNNREGSSDRPRRDGRSGGGRQSAQATNLPAISDLLKPGQELLCQIAKEPIARKGARITSHIALPGRFLVFMPTVNHTGVSRKIESDAERRRLKEILLSEKGEAAGGFIVRTAAANATEEELRSDLRFLLNLWADIKTRSEGSKSPALIYHDLNLVERVLRDQVTDTFSAIWVDTETEYERVLRFLQRFQPSLIRRVKLYTKETPLFEQFGITEEINKALRSKVWLKSGGSIVINQTEALVAIDINTGKFVGKTARLEDTIVKTNLDAIPEIVRQIRLRDLGGIIIIDFIDMDDRKNRNKVMAALEEELKADRAPSKVLQFNDFGLVAITRKRVKQSLERTLSTTCGVCAGTGMVKSPVSVCNDIYIEMRKMQKHLDRGDVMLRVNPEVVKQLKAPGTKWLQEMEEMVGKTILVKSDPALHPEQFDIH